MKAFSLKLGIAVAGLLLTAGPALAQAGGDRGGAGGGDRGGGGGSTTTSGGGMSAGAGGGGSSVSSGGGGSTGGGGGFSSPSASGFSSPSVSVGDRNFRTTAPEHRLSYSQSSGARSHTASSGDQATARPSGGSSSNGAPSRGNAGSADRGAARGESGSGERAVARGTGAAARDAASDNGGSRRMNEGTNNASGANEVPTWSRPRGDRPATDVAVTRVGPQPPRDAHDRQRGYGYGSDGGGYYYDPYYYGGYGWYGTGWGFYDSSFYGYPFYSPFGFGYGIPLGYFDPFYADPYDYGGGYGAYSSNVYGGHDQGSLKLKVKPRNAKVYVDGYYVGLVDEFDGAFQKLTLNGGRHKVELRAEGYETTEFDVLVTPEQTVTFAGDMKKVQ